MNIALEIRRRNRQPELFTEILDKPVNEVPWPGVRPMNERIMALQHLNSRFRFAEARQVRIILPQRITRRPHVDL